ncbi:hypothetical protein CRM22_002662 [Opisthorchis felineus]|uniref:Uncharacterized protein n=1 Tax=Opisthorchis felineus TaxID=147828 RepID=A0A4S2MB76_OPIFE|nr:hypothetical protein CRM22_002662 [Opisthorchis felineus]
MSSDSSGPTSSEAHSHSLQLAPCGSSYAINGAAKKTSNPEDLVELAKQIKSCEQFVTANASSRLYLIAKQMQYLKEQATDILCELRRDTELHNLPCNFVKKPGNSYHVYEKPDGSRYMGLLSPEEWGSKCPHKFIRSYKLLPDMTWVATDDLSEQETTRKMVQQFMFPSNLSTLDNKSKEATNF